MKRIPFFCLNRNIFVAFCCLLVFSIGTSYWMLHYPVKKFKTLDSASVLKKTFHHKHRYWKKKVESNNYLDAWNNKQNTFNGLKNGNNSAKETGEKLNLEENEVKNEITLVLFWYTPYDDITVALEFLFQNSKINLHNQEATVESCPNIKFVFDRSYEVESKYIVFHASQFDIYDLPEQRSRDQFYVWWSAESTASLPLKEYPLDFFNITASYRRTSDVFLPYGTFPWVLKLILNNQKLGKDYLLQQSKLKGDYISNNHDLKYALRNEIPKTSLATLHNLQTNKNIHKNLRRLISKKKGLASWMVSNCGDTRSTSMRFDFASSLRNAGLEVDQFGACNGETFPIVGKWDPAAFQVLARYKFYLAFENSYHCRDYITEKLWMNSLYSGAVPVIFGPHRDDIKFVLPPKSYIFAEDFKNPSHLVKYLHYLDKNVTAYAEYLEWRTWGNHLNRDYNAIPHSVRKYFKEKAMGFCALPLIKTRRVTHDVNKFLVKQERDECLDIDLAYEDAFP